MCVYSNFGIWLHFLLQRTGSALLLISFLKNISPGQQENGGTFGKYELRHEKYASITNQGIVFFPIVGNAKGCASGIDLSFPASISVHFGHSPLFRTNDGRAKCSYGAGCIFSNFYPENDGIHLKKQC